MTPIRARTRRRDVAPALSPLALLVASCLGAEGVARAAYLTVLPRIDQLQNGRAIVELMAEGRTGVPSRIISHPYLLYTNAPNLRADGFQQTNTLGYRNAEFPIEKPSGLTRILVLGGSTTLSYPSVKDPSNTWTARLEQRLNQRPAPRGSR